LLNLATSITPTQVLDVNLLTLSTVRTSAHTTNVGSSLNHWTSTLSEIVPATKFRTDYTTSDHTTSFTKPTQTLETNLLTTSIILHTSNLPQLTSVTEHGHISSLLPTSTLPWTSSLQSRVIVDKPNVTDLGIGKCMFRFETLELPYALLEPWFGWPTLI
jgi:hypothetical protein